MSFPLRPGNGRAGKTCTVRANHFDADVMPYLPMYQYHVRIKPQVRSRDVNRAVMARLVKLYRDSHLGSRLPAYDGSQILYTAGPLPFYSQEFTITLLDEGDGPASPRRRECDFRVVIELASCAPASLQSLNVVLREFPTLCHRPVGRSFYHRRELLGPRLELWRGFYQSVRPTQMGLSLNVDISSSAFIQALPVIEFVGQLLDRRVSAVPLSDSDRAKIMKALKGVRVEVTHRGKMRKKYRISGLTSQTTRELNFPVGDRGTLITLKSVVEYFWEAYGFSIQHVQLPCLQVGNTQRPFYLPMEVCKIVDGQRYSNRLNETQIKALLKVTHQPPQKREAEILKAVRDDAYGPDPYAREFGIQISTRLASVEARILPPPRLKYHDTGRERDCLPSVGRWDMRNKKLVNGGTVDNWMCINFSRNVPDNIAKDFCTKLAGACNYYGMDFNIEPVLPLLTTGRPDQVESVLKACFRNAMTKLQSNRNLICLLSFCQTTTVPFMCCKAKKVIEMSDQYVSSILLKINVKVGGRNTVLADALYRRIPNVSDVPTIIFGADVTHPHAGDESSPSIAAVVASQDWPEITKYAGLVSAQAPRQELIQDLFKEWQDPNGNKVSGGMIKELLMSFVSAVGRKPKRIIFYRDGVSEGQFYQVLLSELHAIRMACASLDPNERDYMPPVTFIVVVKRHHTRLFAANHEDRDDKGNILPGTVVDTKICHPTMFDFYLCSHAAIKGTSRPAHYHVLWDENQFSADALQLLTNDLCYTHARCTSSVSIVPPVYYAHLAAYRARCYMEPDTSHSGSVVSRHAHGANAAVRPLPAVKDNVKRVMYYV